MLKRKIGIMGAMLEEVDSIITLIQDKQEVEIGNRTYHLGYINGIDVVVVFSRWGKVAAATTATSLLLHFKVTEFWFIGVAGAIHEELKIGDIVIAEKLIQHDMDARPLMSQYEIPLLNQRYFEADSSMVSLAEKAVRSLLLSSPFKSFVNDNDLVQNLPQVSIGTIASGDKFFANEKDKAVLRKSLPDVLCVEMEGAAVAQVCYEYKIPFLVIRTISDEANGSSHVDFFAFINLIASRYSAEIVKSILRPVRKLL